jgi:TonB family protein
MTPDITFNKNVVRPIQCLNGAFDLLRGVYGNFLGVVLIAFLVMLVAGCLPLAPLAPPMMCGIYICLLTRMQGQSFSISTLFKGFEFFGPAFIASLVVAVPMMICGFALQAGMASFNEQLEVLKAAKDTQLEHALPAFIDMLVFLSGAVLGLTFLGMLLRTIIVFAYPLIAEKKISGWSAVKLSFNAVLDNFSGVLGLMILEFIMTVAGIMFFYFCILFISPILFAAWAIAYRRVFPAPGPEAGQFDAFAAKSKGGLYLAFASVLLVGTVTGSFAALVGWGYPALTAALKADREMQEKKLAENPLPTPTPVMHITTAGENITYSAGLKDRMINAPTPEYPASARAVKASGTVMVRVDIDEEGKVATAAALSGHPLLKAAAENAARQALFKPEEVAGKTYKSVGVITYKFDPPE